MLRIFVSLSYEILFMFMFYLVEIEAEAWKFSASLVNSIY
jgi:hypothetical protein